MYDFMRATSNIAVLFFVSLVIFGNWILLNLFLANLLSNFQEDDQIVEEVIDEEDATLVGRLKRSITNLLKKKNKDVQDDSQRNSFKGVNREEEDNLRPLPRTLSGVDPPFEKSDEDKEEAGKPFQRQQCQRPARLKERSITRRMESILESGDLRSTKEI